MMTLQEAAFLAEAAYLDREQMEQELEANGFILEELFDHAHTQAALVIKPGLSPVGDSSTAEPAAALVFRGTEASKFNVTDLFANLGIPLLWAGLGRAHSGYVRAMNRIRRPARELAEKVPSEIPLYVIGHSMGGALATLYAAWVGSELGRDRHKIAGVCTFGAPRAASRVALSGIKAPLLRVVNKYDFAPHWPPRFFYSWLPGDFALEHPGESNRGRRAVFRIDSGGLPWPLFRHRPGVYFLRIASGFADRELPNDPA